MKTAFIELMQAGGVLKFGEFKTKSGRLSPYFFNAGEYKTGAQLSMLSAYYAALIYETVGESFDAVFGPAYKGIPLAVNAAAKLYEKYGIDKPFLFNRKEIKDHGEGGNIVGYQLKDGDRIIVTEDVISAGTAVREFMPVLLSNAKVAVKDMFVSLDRSEFGSDMETIAREEIKKSFGITVHSIINVKDIYDYLKGKDAISAVKMKEYMDKYCII